MTFRLWQLGSLHERKGMGHKSSIEAELYGRRPPKISRGSHPSLTQNTLAEGLKIASKTPASLPNLPTYSGDSQNLEGNLGGLSHEILLVCKIYGRGC